MPNKGAAIAVGLFLSLATSAQATSGIVLCLRDDVDYSAPFTVFGSRDAFTYVVENTSNTLTYYHVEAGLNFRMLGTGHSDGFIFFDDSIQPNAMGETGSWTDFYLESMHSSSMWLDTFAHDIKSCSLIVEVEVCPHPSAANAFQLCNS